MAQRTGLPLRLFEIGASAGLNLRWDQYFYDAGDASWGEPSSPVRLDATFLNGRPPLDVQARIAERRGCDTLSIDPRTQEGQLTLMSYVWPDQTERLDLLRGAIEVARRVPVLVEAADAADWLKEQLEKPSPQQATIVFHSVVLQYLSEQGRGAVRMILEEAGRRASGDAPLAWLRMEPGESDADIHLTLWPDETERHIATSGYHGRPVRWLERQPRRT